MGEQQNAFENDDLDPTIAKVADRFIELMDERKVVKEQYEIQELNLMGMLKRAGLKKIRHAGRIIEISHKDESENLKVKEDKGLGKSGKRHDVKKKGEKEEGAPKVKRGGKKKK